MSEMLPTPYTPELEQALALMSTAQKEKREIPKIPDTPRPPVWHPVQLGKWLYDRYLWAPTSEEMHPTQL